MGHQYTPDETDFLTRHVKGRTTKELTELVNAHFQLELTESQIRGFKKNRGLRSEVDARFKTGQVSHNKGKKTGGWKPTFFKKGHVPYNYMPIGTERVNTDGYVDIKIAERTWKAKHVIIWEEANGPVPKDHCLLFGDGNRLNVTLENILLVSKRQLSIMNQKKLIQSDVELTKVGVNIANIYSKISDRKKKPVKRRKKSNGETARSSSTH